MNDIIKILHVEDLLTDAEVIWMQISKSNIRFEKRLVDTRSEYIEALESYKPDIIISDYSLPQFDGMEALFLRNKLAPTIPFILVTGSTNEEIAVESIKSGADDYVIKQNLSRLGSSILSAISRKEILLEKQTAEKKLIVREEMISSIFRAAPTGIGLTIDRNIKEVNPLLCEMTGYTAEELIGCSAEMLYPDRDEYEYVGKEKYEQISKKGTGIVETRWKRKDGRIINVLLASTPLNPEDLSQGVTFTALDISEKKLAEDQLKINIEKLTKSRQAVLNLSENLKAEINERKKVEENLRLERNILRTLIDNIPDPISIKSEDGKYLINNHAHIQLLGAASKDEVVGKTSYDYFPEDVAGEICKDDKRVIESGKMFLNKVESIFNKEKGETRWHLTNKIPLKDSKGKTSQLLTVSHDITDRKKAEEKLSKSEEKYRMLIENQGEGLGIVDLNENFTLVNPAAEEMFGVQRGKLVKRNLKEFLDPDQFGIVQRETEKRSKHQKTTYEVILNRADGEKRTILITATPQFDSDGKLHGTFGVFRDITERKVAETELIKAKEKAEESDKLKTAFLHNISHEIRTPMNAIVGFSNLLKDSDSTPEIRNSYIGIIINSSDQLLSILNDIIEISNIEAGIIQLNKSSVEINSLMNSTLEQFLPKAKLKGIDISCISSLKEESVVVKTDKIKLIQIINNLLSNSLKFTSKGKIEFGYARKGSDIEFYFSDSGEGIPAKMHKMIFNRFFQVENSISRKYEGTGLGLSIAKAFVEMLGGNIWLTSEVGKGSVFYFTIPDIKPDQSGSSVKEMEADTKVEGKSKNTVLIAEDEEYNFMLLEIFLSSLDINIIHAINGKEAVEIVESNPEIDLIIMDLKMPVMDGYAATVMIKKSHPKLPVIAQTAYAYEADRKKAIQAGCDDYISKPVNKASLLSLIAKYL